MRRRESVGDRCSTLRPEGVSQSVRAVFGVFFTCWRAGLLVMPRTRQLKIFDLDVATSPVQPAWGGMHAGLAYYERRSGAGVSTAPVRHRQEEGQYMERDFCAGDGGKDDLECFSGIRSGVSAVAEVVQALVGRESVDQSAQQVPEGLDRSGCHATNEVFESCEDQLDRVEVGAVRRQVDYAGIRRFDGLAHTGHLVTYQVVHHHDMPGRSVGTSCCWT